MLQHQLGNHTVLLLNLFLHLLYLALFLTLASLIFLDERIRQVLQRLLMPLVKCVRVDIQLLADL